jgi:hypothetical protein
VVAQNAEGGAGEFIADLSSYQMLDGTAAAEVSNRTWVPAWMQAIGDFVALSLTEVCLLAMAIFMLGWVFRIVRVRQRQRGLPGGGGFRLLTEPEAVPDFLEEFLGLWSDRGLAKQPGETLREFVSSLRSAGHCGEQFDELIMYAYNVRYAKRERSPEWERQLNSTVVRFRDRSHGGDAS